MNLLNLLGVAIQWDKVGIVIGIFCGIAVLLCILILIITKVCKVDSDEKVTQVLEHLAGANCGGCGHSGCASFAKSLACGGCKLSDCNATSNEEKEVIAQILGIEYEAGAKTRAVVHCNGGINAFDKCEYVGAHDCLSKSMVQGGDKLCSSSCLGEGSCAHACPENAIKMVDGVAVVDKNLCTSCGNCINTCPRSLIDRIPMSAPIYIACSTKCKAKQAMDICKVSCIGCGLCAKVCPQGAITMKDNLPIIDYSKCNGCKLCVQKCPRKCIKEVQ